MAVRGQRAAGVDRRRAFEVREPTAPLLHPDLARGGAPPPAARGAPRAAGGVGAPPPPPPAVAPRPEGRGQEGKGGDEFLGAVEGIADPAPLLMAAGADPPPGEAPRGEGTRQHRADGL